MSNLTDFFPSGGGGLTPKFQEFNATGFFTPSQALIDAGGYIEVFLVGGGGTGSEADRNGGCGGEVLIKKMYLTIAQNNGVTVVIGAGGTGVGGSGGNSEFAASFGAGGVDLIASGGSGSRSQQDKLGAGWGGYNYTSTGQTAGSGTFGYGAGGSGGNYSGGVYTGKNNSGSGSRENQNAGSGYCLIKWYE
jgi:hypothetical protein